MSDKKMAWLRFEMPERCADCQIALFNYDNAYKYRCAYTEDKLWHAFDVGRPPNCPLKEVTDER